MNEKEGQAMDENFYIEREKREFQEAKDRKLMREANQNLGVFDSTGSAEGDHRSVINEEDHKHLDHHVNRKYKMFTTHDSSHDQPTTNTGPGTV